MESGDEKPWVTILFFPLKIILKSERERKIYHQAKVRGQQFSPREDPSILVFICCPQGCTVAGSWNWQRSQDLNPRRSDRATSILSSTLTTVPNAPGFLFLSLHVPSTLRPQMSAEDLFLKPFSCDGQQVFKAHH